MTPITRCFVVILLMLQLAGCGKSGPPPLLIGVSGSSSDALFALAEQHQFFAQEHQPVQTRLYATPAEAAQALAKGEVDAINSNVLETVKLFEQASWQPKIFWAMSYSNGGQVLLARSGINNVAALAGKRVAYRQGTLDVLALYLALQQAKLPLAQIQHLPLPPAASLADAGSSSASLPAAQAETLLAGQGWSKLYDSSQSPEVLLDVLLANETHIRKRGLDLDKMMRALGRAARLAAPQAGQVWLDRAQQNLYFAAGGRLAEALYHADAALRSSSQLSKPACGRLCIDNRVMELPSE